MDVHEWKMLMWLFRQRSSFRFEEIGTIFTNSAYKFVNVYLSCANAHHFHFLMLNRHSNSIIQEYANLFYIIFFE